MTQQNTPSFGGLSYFDGSLYQGVRETARQDPHAVALDYMGKPVTYGQLLARIDGTSSRLYALGIRAGDTVTLALPNCPEAVYLLYALNRLGAVASFLHPLSAEKEMAFALTRSGSKAMIVLDTVYPKAVAAMEHTAAETLILLRLEDGLPLFAKAGYALSVRKHRKTPLPKNDPSVCFLGKLPKDTAPACLPPEAPVSPDDTAVLLYSGGTTGTPKGVLLTNRNLNALGTQVIATNPMFQKGDRMLAAMPLFHGFGLGVCVHAMLAHGGRCILLPRFTAKAYFRHMSRGKCHFVAGVPTLFEALLRVKGTENADLGHIKGVFSGGDRLPPSLKQRMDAFLRERKATVQVREGYGTTETVAACCLTPCGRHKEGSIGLPFPDTCVKIVAPDGETALPPQTEGEILLSGPTVMKGYLNEPEETARTLRRHSDGKVWVCTGDMGYVDSEGFVYFCGRKKRMIVTSGYNVYPGQLEQVLCRHPYVADCCVVGVPDPYKMQRVRAYVQLQPHLSPSEEVKEQLVGFCKTYVASYALPKDMVFVADFPRTVIGKIDYRAMEETGK